MILWRYIVRAHLGPFFFGTFVIVFLFLSQYMIRWLNHLASKGIDAATIGEFLLLNVSWILVLAIPIGVLFSTVMAFGSLSASHEVTVMKASGMGLFKMMIPVIVFGGLLWGFTFWYTDNVLPDTNVRLRTMMRDIEQLKPTFVIDKGKFTTQIEGFTILARDVDTNGVMTGVTIYDKSRPGRQNIVNADSGTLKFSPSLTRLVLDLSNGEVHQSQQAKPADYRIVTFNEHQITMPANRFFYEESDSENSSRGDREMSIADMQNVVNRSDSVVNASGLKIDSIYNEHFNYLDAKSSNESFSSAHEVGEREALDRAITTLSMVRAKLESESYKRSDEIQRANTYRVEIYKKHAIPFACLLFVLVGAPLGIITKGGNFGLSAAISLGCYVLYWAALIGGEKLADRGILDPSIAMWLGNFVFMGIGAFGTYRVNNR